MTFKCMAESYYLGDINPRINLEYKPKNIIRNIGDVGHRNKKCTATSSRKLRSYFTQNLSNCPIYLLIISHIQING